ncbi:stress response protein Nst1 [Streptococcus iniae]|uniref:hypothetical protein n=1 Tax=Streptococcus iniae TaxID=1346 RepID=UPI00035ED8C1|nr:hypothetical protein [Streptococcus iniae]ESR08753.1 hypothetical protein IUSA1_10740 [Streptococcus iniae IUSA1]OHX27980.1 stress response protein Nst1 [Streptococcus iniae]QBX08511.1 hypothetical protein JavanS276_0008 [Streptococcus satellite phage Javan276]RLV26824.1 stress response protein Nst1 [Streptococcus iniae]
MTQKFDMNELYKNLSVKTKQSLAEKEAERIRQVNEEAEHQRAKRDAQQSELQTLMTKGLQKGKEEKERIAKAKQEERIKELEKQWERDRDYKSKETLKYEAGLKSMLSDMFKD